MKIQKIALRISFNLLVSLYLSLFAFLFLILEKILSFISLFSIQHTFVGKTLIIQLFIIFEETGVFLDQDQILIDRALKLQLLLLEISLFG